MRKNYTLFNFLSLGFILVALFLLVSVFQEDNSAIVEFKDEGLELAVREAIGKEEGDLLRKDVELLQELDASDYKIKSLEGIEALGELRELDLEDNFVESVAPLKNTTKLEKLNLRNNEITSLEEIDFDDILFLNIRNLSLRHNVKRDKDGKGTRLSDITMLGEMVSLRKLKLRDNHIEDLSPLSNLRRLTELDIRENKFTTIEPLETLTRLQKLNIRENDIESIEPIKYLSRLEYLNIHSNTSIKSLDPIGNLVNLETLIMRNVSIKNNADFLNYLTKLQRFNAIDSDIDTVDSKTFENLLKQGALQDEVRPIRMLHTLNAPKLSQDSGFYTEGFQLEIENDSDTVEVYYTLDGSEPTLDSDIYTAPLDIKPIDDNTATIVRAKLLSKDKTMSETVTKTYFVDENIDERFTLPIFSLVTDPDNLFDEDIGIYTEDNAFNRGSDWERPTHMEFFEEDGTLALDQEIGIRIHGGYSRKHRQKSLRIYADTKYDRLDMLNYSFFPNNKRMMDDEPIESYKRLLLRNSGNGWEGSMYRDAFMQSLVSPLGTVSTQAYQPSIVFINGEYYGIHNIRERQDEFYYETHYDINPNDLVILENNQKLYRGKTKETYHYKNLLKYIEENDMHDSKTLNHLESLIDFENFIDYFSSQIFFGNIDWPQNNIKFWRKTTNSYEPNAPYGQDGRWRWSMHDTDQGFARYSSGWGEKNEPRDVTNNAISWIMDELDGQTLNTTWANFLFRNMMQNEDFKNSFVNRSNDLINSFFTPIVIDEKVQYFSNLIEKEIPHQIDRWHAIESFNDWKQHEQDIKDFGRERPSYIRQYMMEEFNIDDTVTINIGNETDMGYIRLNTIDINSDLPGNTGEATWSGTYFTGIPTTVEAIAKDGYEFSHWEGIDSNEEKTEITPAGDLNIRAVFIESN